MDLPGLVVLIRSRHPIPCSPVWPKLARCQEGRHVIGVYPVLPDETCWFPAMDFDGEAWQDDVGAVREACARLGIPAGYVSGAGGATAS